MENIQNPYRSFWRYWWQENWVAVICAVFCTLFSWWGPVNQIDGIIRFALLTFLGFLLLYIVHKTISYDHKYYKRITISAIELRIGDFFVSGGVLYRRIDKYSARSMISGGTFSLSSVLPLDSALVNINDIVKRVEFNLSVLIGSCKTEY